MLPLIVLRGADTIGNIVKGSFIHAALTGGAEDRRKNVHLNLFCNLPGE